MDTEKLIVAVVEDVEAARRSLARLLLAAGFGVVGYRSAEAFLADADRPRFDCLLLDVQLEGMSGIDLAERLGRLGVTIPVVFITALDEPEARARALRVQGATFLLKTEPARTVFAAIRRASRSRAETRETGQ